MAQRGRFVRQIDVTPRTDEGTIADLAGTHGQALVTCAYLICRDPELAQDAVQGVFTRIQSRDLTAVDNMAAYLRRAVINEVNSTLRRQRLFQRVAPRLWVKTSQDDPANLVAERQAMWSAIDSLSHRQRAAIVLRYYEDLDDAAIADVLECAPATVRTLVSRALKRLGQQLGEGAPND